MRWEIRQKGLKKNSQIKEENKETRIKRKKRKEKERKRGSEKKKEGVVQNIVCSYINTMYKTCVMLMWNCAGDEYWSDCEFSSWLSGD
jgi:hypothetical protein